MKIKETILKYIEKIEPKRKPIVRKESVPVVEDLHELVGDDHFVRIKYHCPICDDLLYVETRPMYGTKGVKANYCAFCGAALDWFGV